MVSCSLEPSYHEIVPDLPDGSPEQSQPADNQRRDWIASALIPAIAALTGALIGAGVTIFITIYQINTSQHQAVDSFLRSQRQAAYATFLADANKLRNSSARYAYTHAPAHSDVSVLITKLTDDYYGIAILGPDNVAAGSAKIFVDGDCIGEDEHIRYYGFKCGHTPAEDLNKLSDDLVELNHEMSHALAS